MGGIERVERCDTKVWELAAELHQCILNQISSKGMPNSSDFVIRIFFKQFPDILESPLRTAFLWFASEKNFGKVKTVFIIFSQIITAFSCPSDPDINFFQFLTFDRKSLKA